VIQSVKFSLTALCAKVVIFANSCTLGQGSGAQLFANTTFANSATLRLRQLVAGRSTAPFLVGARSSPRLVWAANRPGRNWAGRVFCILAASRSRWNQLHINTNADCITAIKSCKGPQNKNSREKPPLLFLFFLLRILDRIFLLLFSSLMVLLVVVRITVLSRARSGGGDFLTSGFLGKKYYPGPLTARREPIRQLAVVLTCALCKATP